MKIRNLLIVFGISVLGIVSCSDEEAALPDAMDMKVELRDGGPETCCNFEWEVQSSGFGEICCTYDILVNNFGNCQIQIAGFPNNGYVAPYTTSIFEVDVCAKKGITFNVYSNANQTFTLCDSIYLAADCSTQTPCNEDCVFTLQTTDQGKDVQFTHFLRVDDHCTDENSEEFCGDNGEGNVIIKNESGCSDEEVRDIWNAYGIFPVLDLIDFSDYQTCVESAITSRKGCENAQVSVELNNQGGIDYEITYDCASCKLIFIEAQEKSFNVTEDCVGIVFPTGSEILGGPMNCGPCY